MKRIHSILIASLSLALGANALHIELADAAPRKKAKHSRALKVKNAKTKSTPSISQPQVQLAALPNESGEVVGSAPILRGPGTACPAEGRIGISSADEWNEVFSQNLGREIDLCADIELQPGQFFDVRSGFSGINPFEYMYGFQGKLHGNGHTIRRSVAPAPSQQEGVSLGFDTLHGATIENLTIEVPLSGLGDGVTGAPPVIATYSQNSVLRDITLRKVGSASGLIANASNTRFEGISGDVTLRPGASQSMIGGLASSCDNCEFERINLIVDMNPIKLLENTSPRVTRPTYVGGLAGWAHQGYIHASNVRIRGSLRWGYDRGMLLGAMDGSPSRDSNGDPIVSDFIAEDIRVTDADLSLGERAVSYTAGALAGRVSAPSIVRNSLVRTALIESSQQAGGLIGGGGDRILNTALENVDVLATNVAGGMIGLKGGNTLIEDSYFRGTVRQDRGFSVNPVGSTVYGAGGLLGIDGVNNLIQRAYVSAQVTANSDVQSGAIVGANLFGADQQLQTSTENAYFDETLASQVQIGTGLSSAQMLMASSYFGFSPSTWRLQDGTLPRLLAVSSYTIQDLFDFLSAYFVQDLKADLNQSGSVTVEDLFEFLSRYFA